MGRTVMKAVVWLALGGVMFSIAQPAGAASRNDGEFFFPCNLSHRSMDDPIVYPRRPGASHMHDFIGNNSTDAYSTERSLRRATTSCRVKLDKSAYWFPEVIRNGERQRPAKVQLYYRNGVSRTPRAFPAGLKIVQGDHMATSPQKDWDSREFWMCNDGGRHFARPPDCRGWLVLEVIFPQCWDGVHRDSADHHAHMAYPKNGRCPASHPVVLPRVQLQVKFDIHHARSRGHMRLSSGSIYGVHADFFDAWNRRKLRSFIANCIAKGTSCHL